ncbi:hypothetical protein [Streptomyces sp. B21-083]
MTAVVSCFRKGRTRGVRVIKGGWYECTGCGDRWPMSQGDKHP